MAQTNQVTLDMDDVPPAESSTRNNMLHRLDSVPRPSPGNRGNAGLGDRLNSVFREIRPLVEHARMGNNARLSLPTWLPVTHNTDGQQRPPQRPQSSVAHVNLGPNAQTFVVTERNPPLRQCSQPNPTTTSHEVVIPDIVVPEINVSVNPANNNNIQEEADNDSRSDDGVQQVFDVRATLNMLLKYAPFYFILFIKLMYDSRESLFTFSILFITFSYGNTLVRREHGKQLNRNLFALFLELIFTSCVIAVVHYFLGHGRLLPNVIMFPNYTEPIDVWELLWLVVMTDLIVKIITVDIKILITMTPACFLPIQRRGKVYAFVETLSQLYRSVLTIQPWGYFLLGSYTGTERVVGMFLTSVYAVAKLGELLLRVRQLRLAAIALMQSVNLGSKPTAEQMVSAGESCPICHDDYSTPVRLECSHIFCELCISAWLDREHTCPLCRAAVTEAPVWRDGSTTYDFQLY